MTIRIINSTLESSCEAEFATVDSAFAASIEGGLAILADEVRAGATVAIVEIAVDTQEQRYAARGAISVGVARLLTPEQ